MKNLRFRLEALWRIFTADNFILFTYDKNGECDMIKISRPSNHYNEFVTLTKHRNHVAQRMCEDAYKMHLEDSAESAVNDLLKELKLKTK